MGGRSGSGPIALGCLLAARGRHCHTALRPCSLLLDVLPAACPALSPGSHFLPSCSLPGDNPRPDVHPLQTLHLPLGACVGIRDRRLHVCKADGRSPRTLHTSSRLSSWQPTASSAARAQVWNQPRFLALLHPMSVFQVLSFDLQNLPLIRLFLPVLPRVPGPSQLLFSPGSWQLCQAASELLPGCALA